MANTYLSHDNVDDLGRMVTALLTELWIARDRVAVLERILEDKGVLNPDEVNNYVPTPEFEASLEKLRDRMAGNVIGAPLAARERSVDEILARAGMARPKPDSATN
ncbi:MAG TPA: hypothetical protein VIG90_03620 [Pedomonas sp.]|uniref:hypothetical protein n=1 Tax=Pedomonas sp. TaxID=2976421 RepID=UPI002F4150E8